MLHDFQLKKLDTINLYLITAAAESRSYLAKFETLCLHEMKKQLIVTIF